YVAVIGRLCTLGTRYNLQRTAPRKTFAHPQDPSTAPSASEGHFPARFWPDATTSRRQATARKPGMRRNQVARLTSTLPAPRCYLLSGFYGFQPVPRVLRLSALQPAEHNHVPENALHVIARLVVGNVLDPDIRIHRIAWSPALRRARSCVVTSQGERQLAAEAIDEILQVGSTQHYIHRRLEQIRLRGGRLLPLTRRPACCFGQQL